MLQTVPCHCQLQERAITLSSLLKMDCKAKGQKPSTAGRQLGWPVQQVESSFQWINNNGPYILIPVGP